MKTPLSATLESVTLATAVGATIASTIASKVGDEAAGKAFETVKNMMKSGSTDLIQFTQSARIEPIMLLDQRATYVPFVQDVVKTMHSLFTAYWLQAIALDTTIAGVRVTQKLDKFATDRDLNSVTQQLLSMATESLESSLGLPFLDVGLEAAVPPGKVLIPGKVIKVVPAGQNGQNGQGSQGGQGGQSAGSQSQPQSSSQGDQSQPANKEKESQPLSFGVKDVAKAVSDISNLAVGTVVEVTVRENGQEAKVPVTIRLRVAGMSPDVMVQTLAVGGQDDSFKGRWRAWRAGEIRFWSDLVMAMDRIDQHRSAMMKDNTGYYAEVYNRATKNAIVSAVKGGPSLGTASSIIVMTEQTKKELERRINGRLDDFARRQGIFGHTFSMLMAVIDPEWETVTIYHRGIQMPTQLSAKDLKSAGKSDSAQLLEILKSYQLGKAPGRL